MPQIDRETFLDVLEKTWETTRTHLENICLQDPGQVNLFPDFIEEGPGAGLYLLPVRQDAAVAVLALGKKRDVYFVGKRGGGHVVQKLDADRFADLMEEKGYNTHMAEELANPQGLLVSETQLEESKLDSFARLFEIVLERAKTRTRLHKKRLQNWKEKPEDLDSRREDMLGNLRLVRRKFHSREPKPL